MSDSFAALHNKTVLVTRSAGQSSQFTALLQAQAATVLEMPTLEIRPPSSWQALDQAIAQFPQFDWLILTSTNGVDYFLERFLALGHSIHALSQVKIAVVGQKTAARLMQQGIQPDFIPPDFVADSLVMHFPDRQNLPNLRILFPRVETGGREVLVKEFVDRGASVTEVAAYESGCVQTIAPDVERALRQNAVDVVTFASSKTVRCFWQLVQLLDWGDDSQATATRLSTLLSKICIASIGPQTSAACEKILGRVDIEANEYTLEGLTQAIVNWATSAPLSRIRTV